MLIIDAENWALQILLAGVSLNVKIMLKLYTLKEFLPPGKRHISLLFPFWGILEEDDDSPDKGRFRDWTLKGSQFFSLAAAPEDADFFLLPCEYAFESEVQDMVRKLEDLAAKYCKKLLIFFNSDCADDLPVQNALVFRTSLYRSRKPDSAFAMPGWSEDLANTLSFEPRKKASVPTVSYCGYVDYLSRPGFPGLVQRQLAKLRRLSAYEDGRRLRGAIVRDLLSQGHVKTSFIIREGFWAADIKDKKQARLEYVENIFNSDYSLVVRGAGNFSYRLYEVLSLGRIPVIIDTDMVLPYDTFLSWEKYSVWIPFDKVNETGEIIKEFHGKISGQSFVALQCSIRKLYQEWISPTGFYSNLYRYLASPKREENCAT